MYLTVLQKKSHRLKETIFSADVAGIGILRDTSYKMPINMLK